MSRSDDEMYFPIAVNEQPQLQLQPQSTFCESISTCTCFCPALYMLITHRLLFEASACTNKHRCCFRLASCLLACLHFPSRLNWPLFISMPIHCPYPTSIHLIPWWYRCIHRDGVLRKKSSHKHPCCCVSTL